MYHRVYASKYRQEIISLVWDFLDQLTPGDPISLVTLVDIIVSSGIDANPLDMIFNSPVLSGSVVTQQIRRGIPGTIYTVTITVETVGGDIFEDVCYLAILPLEPFPITVWETTQLYPLEESEFMQGFTILQVGRLELGLYAIPPEGIQGFHLLESGILTQQVVPYHNPHEDIQGFFILESGILLKSPFITYHIPHEDIQGFHILVSGELERHGILYIIPHEDIQGFTILTSGILT